jgi:hypothetical protein
MKKLHWILIALALVVIVVLTMPKDGFTYNACQHDFDYDNPDACHVYHCSKCGATAEGHAQHSWKKVDCKLQYCTVCNKTASSYHDFSPIYCTNKLVCKDCQLVQYTSRIQHAPSDKYHYVDCSYQYICKLCQEVTSEGVEHTWSTYAKHQNAHCLVCGISAPASHEHNLTYSLFFFIGVCKDCGHISFQIPTFRYVAAFIGLLLTIAAFIYIFVNRKRITVQGGKYIRTATPDAYVREGEAERHPF